MLDTSNLSFSDDCPIPLLLNKDKLKFVPPYYIGVKYAVSKEANIHKNSRECSISIIIIAYVMGGRPDLKALTERLLRVWQPWSFLLTPKAFSQ